MEFKSIGKVKNRFRESCDPHLIKKHNSLIIIDKEYEEGLYRIEESEFIDIVFMFHLSEGYTLTGPKYDGQIKGVFASRSPRRPNPVGVTTVKLVKRDGNELEVAGLDALDSTPVLDIKTCDISFFKDNYEKIDTGRKKFSPRWDIIRMIKTGDMEGLLMEAGKLHGHFCPGLSMGVMAAAYAMKEIRSYSDGWEDLIAVTETNSCFADGVQFVTGCTFGNNALIFRDIGKSAFTLTGRDGKGIRIAGKNDSYDHIREKFPDFFNLFNKVVIEKNHSEEDRAALTKSGIDASFGMLKLDFYSLFKVQKVNIDIPEYAPIHDSIICNKCGENAMASRITEKDNSELCFDCAGEKYYILDGHGIKIKANGK